MNLLQRLDYRKNQQPWLSPEFSASKTKVIDQVGQLYDNMDYSPRLGSFSEVTEILGLSGMDRGLIGSSDSNYLIISPENWTLAGKNIERLVNERDAIREKSSEEVCERLCEAKFSSGIFEAISYPFTRKRLRYGREGRHHFGQIYVTPQVVDEAAPDQYFLESGFTDVTTQVRSAHKLILPWDKLGNEHPFAVILDYSFDRSIKIPKRKPGTPAAA